MLLISNNMFKNYKNLSPTRVNYCSVSVDLVKSLMGSFNLKTHEGLRDMLIINLLYYCQCRVRDLFFFEKKNWTELVEKGYTHLELDSVKKKAKLLRVDKEFNAVFMKNKEIENYFDEKKELICTKTGKILNKNYIVKHINDILLEYSTPEEKLTTETIRKLHPAGAKKYKKSRD